MDFNIDNQQKTLSGKASNLTLAEVLDYISKIPKLNISVSKNYMVGYKNCEQQFKMDYKICFHDFNDEIWLIKSTSSIRSDRLYGNEFFAQNIKIIDDKVTNIFVVIPDSVNDKEIQNKIAYSNKIHSNTYVSFIDDVFTFSQLRNKIIEHASENLTQGVSANILGNNAEETIAQLLNDHNNWLLWNDYKKNNKLVKSATFRWFKNILSCIDFDNKKQTIQSISATKDIPKLSNGGYPKTDVSFTIYFEWQPNNKTVRYDKKTYSISIKNTYATTVTVHEGDISDVIIALNIPNDSLLADSLRQFQIFGSAKGLLENNPEAYKTISEQLPLYNEKLIEFFIFGVNSHLITDNIQIADIILYTNNFEAVKREKYINTYLSCYKSNGQFGTPFKWTYPSKKRGQKIQIKGFTNNKK